LLDTKNVDVNARDGTGQTALMLVTQTPYFIDCDDYAKILLRRNDVNVNALDSHQQTALMWLLQRQPENKSIDMMYIRQSTKRLVSSLTNRMSLWALSVRGGPKGVTASEYASYRKNKNLVRIIDQVIARKTRQRKHTRNSVR
jgi:ankyrin repeat protein